MRLRIKIKTPKGYAASTSKRLLPFIIGSRKVEKHEIYANKADDTIIWIVDADVREAFKIQRNMALFDKTTSMILKNRTIRGLAKLSKEDQKELDDMLQMQTKIRVIKYNDEMPDLKGWDKDI